jgi:hypothetical protein
MREHASGVHGVRACAASALSGTTAATAAPLGLHASRAADLRAWHVVSAAV